MIVEPIRDEGGSGVSGAAPLVCAPNTGNCWAMRGLWLGGGGVKAFGGGGGLEGLRQAGVRLTGGMVKNE
jgi:hypothetical protein